jgi:septum site-determining protein MinC
MAPAAHPDSAPASFELKSSSLALESLLLKTADWQLLAQDLERQFGPLGDSPDFFDFDGLIVDVSQIPADQTVHDLAALHQLLQRFKLLPVALRGGNEALLAQAQALGWAQASPEVSRGKTAKAPVAQELVREVVKEVIKEVRVEVPAASTASTTAGKPAMVVDKPLRSGQKVYAKGCDLIVLAMVNQDPCVRHAAWQGHGGGQRQHLCAHLCAEPGARTHFHRWGVPHQRKPTARRRARQACPGAAAQQQRQ